MSAARVYGLAAEAAHMIEPALLKAWRWVVRSIARDDSSGSSRRSCVVVAPHPDDETIGCGATIASKRASGTPVTVVVVADGRHAQSNSTLIDAAQLAEIRAQEVVEACGALGVGPDQVLQLHFEDTHVDEREDALVAQLVEILRSTEPEEVLVISRHDHHPDHRSVNRATYRALAVWGQSVQVLEFPVWSWIDGPWLDQRSRSPLGRAIHLLGAPFRTVEGGRPTIVSTEGFLEAKRMGLAAHASQTTPYTGEPEWAVMEGPMLDPFLGSSEIFLPPPRDRRQYR